MTACWATRPEGGGERALRFLLRAVLLLGPHAARALVLPIAAWCFVADRPARAASRAFLRRVLPVRPGPRHTWRHLRSFATAVLDRAFLLAGDPRVVVDAAGLDLLAALERRGQGCILLGAHLGSFEALRILARRSPVPIRALMFRENEGALTRVLEGIDPAVPGLVIPIGRPDAMLAVRECIAAGGIVGMLADRTPRGEREVAVPFLGSMAAFPAGPFVVAAVLDAPVLLFSAVRTGPRRYLVTFEPFADRVVLRRTHRTADLRDVAARFAARLELKCRQHPYEWFNFFPFWPEAEGAAPPRPVRRRGVLPAGLGAAD